MKKSAITGLLALAALAGQAQSLTVIEGGEMVGGYMPEAISPNGTYIGGSTYAMAMFMSEWQQQNTLLITPEFGSVFDSFGAEIRSVNDLGIGVGYDDNGAVIVDFPKAEYIILQSMDYDDTISDIVADAITADSSIITGALIGAGWIPSAVYWKDGVVNYLPEPDEATLGFPTSGSRALCISDDGSVIVGYVVDKFSTYPMIMWTRDTTGNYICNPVCAKWFGNDPGQFVWFEPKALSPDGTKVAMQVMYAVENESDPLFAQSFPAIYDIPTGTIRVAKISGDYGIEPGETCSMFNHAISNDGTMVGWVVTNFGFRKAFIMYPDIMEPQLLSMAFPEVEKLLDYDELGEHALSGISADGKYICGMGVNISTGYPMYEGYVFDTGKTSAVSSLKEGAEGSDIYYSIDGRRLSAPQHGINIIRHPDGTTQKIMKIY